MHWWVRHSLQNSIERFLNTIPDREKKVDANEFNIHRNYSRIENQIYIQKPTIWWGISIVIVTIFQCLPFMRMHKMKLIFQQDGNSLG